MTEKPDAQRLAEVRRRVIMDYYTGPVSNSIHLVRCFLCGRTWRYEETESHKPGCPMEINNAKQLYQ